MFLCMYHIETYINRKVLLIIMYVYINSHDSWANVIVHHKNPYSLPGFEPGTSGFVVFSSIQIQNLKRYLILVRELVRVSKFTDIRNMIAALLTLKP
jgi:hypothetical protein